MNARLNLMKKRDTFNTILKNNVPARVFAGFQKNILRPNNNFGYTQGDETIGVPVAGTHANAGGAAADAAAPRWA